MNGLAQTKKVLTKYRRATPPSTNQNRTIRPDIPRIRAQVLGQIELNTANAMRMHEITYNQFLRAHHSVNKKNAARTRHATLLALVSNPHAIKQAPMNEEPRYPAGRVTQGIPPDIRVSPPSSATYSVSIRRSAHISVALLTVQFHRVDGRTGQYAGNRMTHLQKMRFGQFYGSASRLPRGNPP